MTEIEQAKSRIKKRLNSYNDLDRERRQLADQLARLQARLTPGGQNLDGMPRGPGVSDGLADTVAARLDLLERYQVKLHELDRAQADIESLIDDLDPVERTLTRAKYIEGRTWEEVCVVMAYSWRQVHRIHARVLGKLAAAENNKEETTNECD